MNGNGATLFSDDAIFAVHEFSFGIPRLVNTLCENSLLSGYSRQAKQITPEIVQEVAADLRLGLVTTPSAPESGDLEESKEVLKLLLTRMIEELEASVQKPSKDMQIDSYVKTK